MVSQRVLLVAGSSTHVSPRPWAMMTVAVCFLSAGTTKGARVDMMIAAMQQPERKEAGRTQAHDHMTGNDGTNLSTHLVGIIAWMPLSVGHFHPASLFISPLFRMRREAYLSVLTRSTTCGTASRDGPMINPVLDGLVHSSLHDHYDH